VRNICSSPPSWLDRQRAAPFLKERDTPRDPRARTLRGEAHHHIRLDLIFRLRTGLTPSPTNGCKSAAFAPPSRPPSQGEYHDKSRRYSDVLLRQRVLCGSYSRGYNSACLMRACADVHARRLQPPITNCLAPAAPLRSEHPLGALCTLPADASAP